MKFTQKTVKGITGNITLFEYSPTVAAEKFTIYAYDSGIELVGQSPRIKSQNELETFARAITTAWQRHLQLKGENHVKRD